MRRICPFGLQTKLRLTRLAPNSPHSGSLDALARCVGGPVAPARCMAFPEAPNRTNRTGAGEVRFQTMDRLITWGR